MKDIRVWYYLYETGNFIFRVLLFPIWFLWRFWKQIDQDFDTWQDEVEEENND